ncbi:hypothetical protein [Flavobacterium sp.]|uniref:hypothetical protein n=1 Tax=Flavobacterium sp. TaxID=239 RepID=UPI00261AB56D|nr:hypothetical protein [Flavobacterium sp.]
MRKYILLSIMALMLINCSSDDASSGLNSGDGQGGSLATFVLKGNYLYAVDDSKINVFSLINSQTPVQVNNVPVGFRVETLSAQDNYLFVGSQTGMFIYSLENPENPVLISLAQHFTSCDPVISNGPLTFVSLHSNTVCGGSINVVEIYNTVDVYNPLLLTSINLIEPKGIGLYGHYLFVCDDIVKIFDIQNPMAPVFVKSINVASHDVIIKGDDLFAIGNGGLYRYELHPNDINDITEKSTIDF